MKVVILYRSKSDHGTEVESYVRDMKIQTGAEPKLLEVDSQEGINLAKLYDIVEYPAVIATRDDGELMEIWAGRKLPLLGEVAYYARQ